ncbi:cytochrome c5 family protein [Litorivivens sp.]|uniref:c-type cytochrome n=1 Tax=Litorivivens sp. TaxID=2020868 RepID=UPI0035635162
MKKSLAALLFSAVLVGTAQADALEDRYNRTCAICHAAGAAGAPRTGDADTWNKRIEEKGMDTLIENAKNGIKAMPPKGMCFDCSDEDFKALIELMAKPKS